MANEAQIRASLLIQKGNLRYQSQPTAFSADITTGKGPVPGAIAVATTGTNVDLSELEQPGFVRLMNLDETNYVEWGVWDTERSVFFQVGELKPGEIALFRLSRNFGEEFAGPGTGTTAATNLLRLMANIAACVVLVEAFDS